MLFTPEQIASLLAQSGIGNTVLFDKVCSTRAEMMCWRMAQRQQIRVVGAIVRKQKQR